MLFIREGLASLARDFVKERKEKKREKEKMARKDGADKSEWCVRRTKRS